MSQSKHWILLTLKTIFGCALFGLGFNLFLLPNGLNAGGLSGLAMVLTQLIGFGTVGTVTIVMNIPLFLLGGLKIGKRFLFGSVIGMAFCSLAIDLMAYIPMPELKDPLTSALYGGVLCGIGLGVIFASGGSTGGSDIIVRLLKLRWQNVPIGKLNIIFDLSVAALTGLVFRDISRALYSGVAIFVTGQIIDAVVYRFDYSKVTLIITKEHDRVAKAIASELDRGATFLHGEGSYSHQQLRVVLTAVKKQQLADLKRLVVKIDPNAFIIVQEAHQVLGDGFSRYSKDAL